MSEKSKLLYSNGYYRMIIRGERNIPDVFMMFTKDGEGEKKLNIVVHPEVYIGVSKEAPEDASILPLYVPLDSVNRYKVPYAPKKKMLAIAELFGEEDKWDYNVSLNELRQRYLKDPMIHDADMDIEDYFMDLLDQKFDKDILIDKAFYDIEVNGANFQAKGNDWHKEPGAPIVMMGVFFDGVFYEFLFRDPEIEDREIDRLFDDEDFREEVRAGIIEKERESGLEELEFFFYEDEAEMIQGFYDFMNTLKPEMAAAWNLEYDICYSLNRYSYLQGKSFEELEDVEQDNSRQSFGYERSFFTQEAREMICDTELINAKIKELKDVARNQLTDENLSNEQRAALKETYEKIRNLTAAKLSNAYYYKDGNTNNISDRGDSFKSVSYTNYVDQMIMYAYIRKSNKKSSYALDNIADEELDDRKDPLPKGVSMKNFFSKAYILSLYYNVHDVMLQVKLEAKNKDMQLLWTSSQGSSTRLSKAGKKTVSIRNLARKMYREQGFMLSNNHNMQYLGERASAGKKTGGFVGDPNLINYTGVNLDFTDKRSSRIFANVIDEDLSSQYPSIIIALGIEDPTLVGKLQLKRKVPSEKEDGLFVLVDDGWKIIDSYISGDNISIGRDFLDLPSLSEMIDILDLELSDA